MLPTPPHYLDLACTVRVPAHVDENGAIVQPGDRVAITYGGQPATGTVSLRVVPVIHFDSQVEGGVASAGLEETTRMVKLEPGKPVQQLTAEHR